MKIKLVGNNESVNEFKKSINDSFDYSITRTFQVTSYVDAAVHILTVSGGVAAIAKCIIEYLKVKHASRKMSIITNDERKIEIEANSIEEIEKLIEISETIMLR